jgi:hypothetical protein
MLYLTTITDFLELQTQDACSTDWTASWVDVNLAAGTFVPGSASGNTAAIGTLTMVAAPLVNVQRQLKHLTVLNRHATANQIIVVDKHSGGVGYNLTGPFPLAPGDSLQYIDTRGFFCINAQGQEKFVGATGPTGLPGATGPTGPGASTTYTFTQGSPSLLWTVTHNLGRWPAVSVVDSSGSEVDGDTLYIDSNNLTIGFSAPFSGLAYLN